MTADPREHEIIALIREMLGRPEYLLPLAAAEHQFRAHYYRLNAGALLEDLFADAMTNFVNLTRPEKRLRRAPKGESEWDYEYEDLRVSHKVHLGGGIAVLWDATIAKTEWSASNPILLIVGNLLPGSFVVTRSGDSTGKLTALASDSVLPGRCLVLARWAVGASEVNVLRSDRVPAGAKRPWDVLPFRDLWVALARQAAAGVPLNELDVYVTRSASFFPALGAWSVTAAPLRPGAYLLSQSAMQSLGVKRNNRAVLLPKETVRELMLGAQAAGLFVPLSLWYQGYAEDRPPDLYSVQRREFDDLFGPQGFRR